MVVYADEVLRSDQLFVFIHKERKREERVKERCECVHLEGEKKGKRRKKKKEGIKREKEIEGETA